MGIGSVTSTGSMSFMQMTTANKPDAKSKKIQDDITNVERELQKISSDAELSYADKTEEQKALKKEISSLNTKLDQRQEELLRSQKQEDRLAQLREDADPAKKKDEEDNAQVNGGSSDTAEETNAAASADGSQEVSQGSIIASTGDGTVILKEETKPNEAQAIASEKEQAVEPKEEDAAEEEKSAEENGPVTDTGLSSQEMRAMVSADASAREANRQGTIITKTEDGIAILKGEMKQDEQRGVNTERKQAELQKMYKQEERATAFQFSELGKAMNTMKSAAEANMTGADKTAPDNTENTAYTTAIRAAQEEQRFQVSIA